MRTIFLFLFLLIVYLIYASNSYIVDTFTVSSQSCDNNQISIAPDYCLDVSNCECPPGAKFYGNKCLDCKEFPCRARDITQDCCLSDNTCKILDDTCVDSDQICKNIENHDSCPEGYEWHDENIWIPDAKDTKPFGNPEIDFCCERKPIPPWNPCDNTNCDHGTCEIVDRVPQCICEDGWTGYHCNASCGTPDCILNTDENCCPTGDDEACEWDGKNCKNKQCDIIKDEKNCSGLSSQCCYVNWPICSVNLDKGDAENYGKCGPPKKCNDCIDQTPSHTIEDPCGPNGYCDKSTGKCNCNAGYSGDCCLQDCNNEDKCENRIAREECCNVPDKNGNIKCKLHSDGVSDSCQYYIKAGTALLNPSKSLHKSRPEYCTSDSDCEGIGTICDISTNYCIPSCNSATDTKCIYPKEDKYYKTMDEITQELFGRDSENTDFENMYCTHNLTNDTPFICPYGPTECSKATDCQKSRLCNPFDPKCTSINSIDITDLNTTSCNASRCEWIGYDNNKAIDPSDNICEINYNVTSEAGQVLWCCENEINDNPVDPVDPCDTAIAGTGCISDSSECPSCLNGNLGEEEILRCYDKIQAFCKPVPEE